jgi:hypothetical protein
MSRRILVFVFAWGLFLGLIGTLPASAQEGAPAATKKTEKKERAEPAGRLPAYFSQVVSPEQRTKIYALQASYREKILALAEQMKKITAERDAEIEKVLTAEQLEKVTKLREEAAKKRAENAAAREAAKKQAADTPGAASTAKPTSN